MTRRAWVERTADGFIPRPLLRYREQVLYVAVGGWNTLFGYAIFAILYFLVGDVVGSSVVIVASYLVAIANAYIGYRYVAFRSHGSVLHELPRFSAVYLATMVVNLVFFPIALQVLPLSPYLVQALFMFGVVVVSYVGHRHFSFALPRHAAPRPDGQGGPDVPKGG
jgi:putative flippase GtrA